MKIVQVSFSISSDDLSKSSPEDIESSIKDEIIKHITDTLSTMVDDEGFITMTPSEDNAGFDIEINLILVIVSGQIFDRYNRRLGGSPGKLMSRKIRCGL